MSIEKRVVLKAVVVGTGAFQSLRRVLDLRQHLADGLDAQSFDIAQVLRDVEDDAIERLGRGIEIASAPVPSPPSRPRRAPRRASAARRRALRSSPRAAAARPRSRAASKRGRRVRHRRSLSTSETATASRWRRPSARRLARSSSRISSEGDGAARRLAVAPRLRVLERHAAQEQRRRALARQSTGARGRQAACAPSATPDRYSAPRRASADASSKLKAPSAGST